MLFRDFSNIVLWWSVIFFLGALFFPFSQGLFKRFIDRGYIFSKIIGILVLSYISWLLSITHLLPFSKPSLLFILSFFLIGNLSYLGYLGYLNRSSTKKRDFLNRSFLLLIFFEELIFFLALLAWSFVKAHQPDINSLEKFMDFGFINSILRSDFLPPLDMWLAKSPAYPGHFINYYYFGHYVTAVLTKLSQIDAGITYNLMLSTVFAFTFTGSFSIAINLIQNIHLEGVASRHLPGGHTEMPARCRRYERFP